MIFLCVKKMKVIPRHKWNILDYIGSVLPPLSALQKEMIRKQLEERYCPECGEYIYNPFRRRKIQHFHHLQKKHKFVPLLQKRVLIHPHNQLVEWTRHFPKVMKLMTLERDIFFYKNFKPQFIHRIPAVRMWTIDEWNTLHPTIYIWKEDCIQRIQYTKDMDCLFTPDLIIV